MDRKLVICHICGVPTKRFGEHLASAHRKRDFKSEKVSFVWRPVESKTLITLAVFLVILQDTIFFVSGF